MSGELLIDVVNLGRVFRKTLGHSGGPVAFSEFVPDDVAFCGTTVYTQGLCTGGPVARLSNALDARVARR